ncbi:Thymidylate synthase thyX [Rickettsiales bacterium Ac37b]|nr:Thymidylate synthase thyX [Rickettsiales bacterium Ac37b]
MTMAPKTHDLFETEINSTIRATSASLEKILYQTLPVLDHGFIRVIDYMGNDAAITQAARISYGKGTKKINEDTGLIRYLMRHKHTSPFEMCEIKFHIKLPIFIARQWIRHRTANVNEYSARYSILSKEFYLPSPENIAPQSTTNKQGRSDDKLTPEQTQYILNILKTDAEMCYAHYQELLNEDEQGNIIDPDKVGLSRELARMNLNLNFYTEWYWKIDLYNLLHFLSLRADNHAQYEIRAYAVAILNLVKDWVPITYEAFMEYNVHGVNVSCSGLNTIKAMLKGEKPTQETSNMSKREWNELMQLLELN